MKVIQGHTITLKAIINGVERFFAGTVANDFNLSFDVLEKLTKKDAGQRRYSLGGYSVNIGITGITEIAETTTEKAQNLSRADILDLILAAAPVKFVYEVDGDVLSGDIILHDFLETSDASGLANYTIRTKLSGALSRYKISGEYVLETLTAPDVYAHEGATLSAEATITANAAGSDFIKFVWNFGAQVVEYSDNYTFTEYQTQTINASAAIPAGITPGAYTLTISGAVNSTIVFNCLPVLKLEFNITAFASQTISLTTNSTTTAARYIDWGDGVVNTLTQTVTATTSHTYAANGVYNVLMYGNLDKLITLVINNADRLKSLSNVDATYLTGLYSYNYTIVFVGTTGELGRFICPNVSVNTTVGIANAGSAAIAKFREIILTDNIQALKNGFAITSTDLEVSGNNFLRKLDLTKHKILAVYTGVCPRIRFPNASKLTEIIGGDFTKYKTIDFSGCALPVATIDKILIDAAAGTVNGGTLNVGGGTNAAPSAAGVANKNILVSRGWVVTTK